jgi:hypothetical protein
MRLPLALTILSALPVQARDLLCIPQRICTTGSCEVPAGGPLPIRLVDTETLRPVLHSYGETIQVAKILEGFKSSTWEGTNAAGELESVTLHQDLTLFVHTIGGAYVRFVAPEIRYRATGTCEVQ